MPDEIKEIILLIEDNLGTAELVCEKLGEDGKSVAHVKNGKEARAWLEHNQSQLILLDYSLPDMTGAEFVQGTRDMPPFIVVTGAGNENTAVMMMKRGARDYLVKDTRFLENLPLVVGQVLREIVTERQLVEVKETLRKNHENLGALIENTDGSIWSIDRQCNLFVGNERFHQDVSASLGRRLETGECVLLPSFPPAICAEWRDYYDRALRGEHFHIETMTRFRSVPAYMEYSFSPILGATGSVEGVTIFGRDITERKQAEDALRLSELDLKEAQSTAHIGNWKWDLKNGKITWSDEMYHIFGIDKASHTGRLGDVIKDAVHPDDLHLVLPSNAPAFAEKKPIEYRIIRPDGSIRHIWAKSGDVVVDSEGSPVFLTGVAQDITERKRAEDELCITKEALEAANLKLQVALAREKELARTDVLTGINNRRCLFELAEHEFEIATRYQQSFSVIMFDIDRFKEVNDTFGHMAGDLVLQRVTQAACAELRSVDVIGRYGGEEFVIVLPVTNAQDAYSLAERIRARVVTLRVSTEKGDASVTISIGIAETRHTLGESLDSILICADKAMYAAKNAGRNRTVICEEREVRSEK